MDRQCVAHEITLWICPGCGGYEPLTSPDYVGHLSGECDVCHGRVREVHRFGLALDLGVLGPCECVGGHVRRETC